MNFAIKIFFTLVYLLVPSSFVFAHVGYVVSEREIEKMAGTDFDFILGSLREPANLLLILVTIAAILLIYFFLKRSNWFISRVVIIGERAESYNELIPWMLRLGVGIALIGAGVAGVFISPALPGFASLSFLQILLGFLFLVGFLLAPAILFAFALFLIALYHDFYLFGNLDFFAALVALLILARPKPGLDDLLGISFFSPLKFLKEMVPLVLRIGIGGAMMFLAIYEKFLNPHLAEAVVHNYNLTSIIPVSAEMWVFSAGLIELAVGFLLLIGLHTRLVVVIAFAVLSLSFFYFGEGVYSHVTLFSVLSVLFVTGGGGTSMDRYFVEKRERFFLQKKQI